VAAVAANVATFYAKQAAVEARKTATAAADQVELQRPRPIVIVSFQQYFGPNPGNPILNDTDFHLQNIGDSPAFDVVVSTLKVPGKVPYFDEPSQLTTRNQSSISDVRTGRPTGQAVPAVEFPRLTGIRTPLCAGFATTSARYWPGGRSD
jgi:hypothetical protein